MSLDLPDHKSSHTHSLTLLINTHGHTHDPLHRLPPPGSSACPRLWPLSWDTTENGVPGSTSMIHNLYSACPSSLTLKSLHPQVLTSSLRPHRSQITVILGVLGRLETCFSGTNIFFSVYTFLFGFLYKFIT